MRSVNELSHKWKRLERYVAATNPLTSLTVIQTTNNVCK